MWVADKIIFGMYLMTVGIIDVKKRKIKLWILYGGIVLAGLLRFLADGAGTTKERDLLFGIICGGFFLVVSWMSRERFGYADSMAIMSLFIQSGFETGLVCVTVAFVLGAGAAVILIAAKKANRETALPFLPYLFVGYVTGVILA